jgi:ATP-dependent helicase/nuclease subunit A
VSEESDVLAAELAEPGAPRKPREGRFGHRFGHTVHHALALVLRDDALEVSQAVRLAAARFGLAEHLDEAAADVRRALAALRTEGLAGPVGPGLQVEYPVAAAWEGGRLLAGYVDLVAAPDGRLDVIDVKTDAPPPGPVEETYREYAAQVRLYGRLLDAAGLAAGRHLRCGLLFTSDAVMRWVAA